MGSQSSWTSLNCAFNPQHEQAIQYYLIWQDVACIPAKLLMLLDAANYLSKQSYLDLCTLPPTISPCPLRRLLNRNKHFFKKKQKPLIIHWKNPHNIENFTIYLKKYQEIRIQKEMTDADVSKMNETEFYVRCWVAYLVITMDTKKKLLPSDPNSKVFLTGYKNISGRGLVIPPILILI